MHQVPTS